MSDKVVRFIGVKELKKAIRRAPETVETEGAIFLQRGLAAYRSAIVNNPWRIGGKGGGAPVSNDPRYRTRANKGHQRANSGNLRDTHTQERRGLMGWIGPNLDAAPYAEYVHDGTTRMEARPWLDYAMEQKETEIEQLYDDLLRNVIADLAR